MSDQKTFSLEYVLSPKMVNQGFFGYVTKEKLIDIETPAPI